MRQLFSYVSPSSLCSPFSYAFCGRCSDTISWPCMLISVWGTGPLARQKSRKLYVIGLILLTMWQQGKGVFHWNAMYTYYAHTHKNTYMKSLCANVHLHVDILITSSKHAHSQLPQCYLGHWDHVLPIQIFSQRAREQDVQAADADLPTAACLPQASDHGVKFPPSVSSRWPCLCLLAWTPSQTCSAVLTHILTHADTHSEQCWLSQL